MSLTDRRVVLTAALPPSQRRLPSAVATATDRHGISFRPALYPGKRFAPPAVPVHDRETGCDHSGLWPL